MIYWFTGQPGAGKTTLCKELLKTYPHFIFIDADEIRDVVGNKDYSKEGREKNIVMIQKLAKLFHDRGHTVLVACIAPFRAIRDEFKAKEPVFEVYVKTTQERGKEKFFVKDYEPPTSSFVLDTNQHISNNILTLQNIIDHEIPRSCR